MLTANTEKERIQALAQRVVEANYPPNTVRSVGGIDPHTIDRWAKGVSEPRRVSLKALCKIIAITEETLRQYLDREIDLDTLWARVGESTSITAAVPNSFSQVLYLAKNLPGHDKMRLVQELVKNYPSYTPTPPPIVPLTPQNKTRLKTLAAESLRYRESNLSFFTEKGINELFLTDVLSQFKKDYTQEYYDSLASLLYKAQKWVKDDLVVLDYPNTYQDWDELSKDLE